jgi:hypothetical protein
MEAILYIISEEWYMYNNTKECAWDREKEREIKMVVYHTWHKHMLWIVWWKVKSKPLCLAVVWWWSSTCELVTSFFTSLNIKWDILHVGAPVNIHTKRHWLCVCDEHSKHCFSVKVYQENRWPQGTSASTNLNQYIQGLNLHLSHKMYDRYHSYIHARKLQSSLSDITLVCSAHIKL